MRRIKQNRTNEANDLQQNRTNEANDLQRNRTYEANSLQCNRQTNFNNYNNSWGGYYSGAGFGAGLAIGATLQCCLPPWLRSPSPGTHTTMRTASTTNRRAGSMRWCHRLKARSLQRRPPPDPPSMSAVRPISIVAVPFTARFRAAIR
jgi:hypothetical protein